jgi:antitoxin (DNA-binding transcriptional repressor) of toxin-antitoxin stability system
MAHTVSARESSQRFYALLGRAAGGEMVVITRRGEPVAQLRKYSAAMVSADRHAAWDRLIAHLEIGVRLGAEAFERDDLYAR